MVVVQIPMTALGIIFMDKSGQPLLLLDLQTWTKITPILALVGVLVLLSSQGQFFLLYTAYTKGKTESGKKKSFFLLLSPTFIFLFMVFLLQLAWKSYEV